MITIGCLLNFLFKSELDDLIKSMNRFSSLPLGQFLGFKISSIKIVCVESKRSTFMIVKGSFVSFSVPI